jgi:hypothetical protein
MFADDTNIFVPGKSLDHMFRCANEDLSNTYNWLAVNKLTLNTDKTKYILFNQNTSYSTNRTCPELIIKGEKITRVENYRFLGVLVNQNLSWKNHMTGLLNKIKRNLSVIWKIRPYLNQNCLKMLYHSFIISHVKYCLTTWHHGNQTLISKIQSTCNNFVRMIYNIKKRKSVTE